MKKLLNKIRDAKLRTKLSLVILLVGIVPILLLSQTLLSEFGGIMRSEESTSMNTSLQQATATVENQVTQDGLLCRYVVFSDSIQQVLSGKDTDLYDRYQLYSQSAKQILNTSRYLQKGAQSITIYSQNIPVSSGTSLQPLQNMQEKDWYYQIQPGSGLQWFLDSTAPNTLDSVCLTSNYLGTGKSYLVVRYSLSTFLQPFCEMKQKNTDVAVFRGDKLLYSTGTLAKSSTSQANAAAAMRSRGTCEKRHISGLNWDVYLCADGSVISDAARAAFFRTAMIFLLCLLILVAMDRL
ncbi:MAG: hypothetical protein PHU79_08195, partial [Oscillospiraceae bacterium]|nr:hypothetical protein [Oscillospiraceae bacterium]